MQAHVINKVVRCTGKNQCSHRQSRFRLSELKNLRQTEVDAQLPLSGVQMNKYFKHLSGVTTMNARSKKVRRSALSGGYIGTKCSPTHWKHSSNPPQNPKYSIISVRQSLWPTAQLETTKKHLQRMFKKPSNQPRVARGPQAANIHHCCRSVERHTSVRRRTQAP